MNGKKIKINRAPRYEINTQYKNALIDGQLRPLEIIDVSSSGLQFSAPQDYNIHTNVGHPFIAGFCPNNHDPILLELELIRSFPKNNVIHYCYKIVNIDEVVSLGLLDWLNTYGRLISERFIETFREDRLQITPSDYEYVHESSSRIVHNHYSKPIVVNLSSKGLCLKSSCHYSVGDHISLEIAIAENVHLSLTGTVQWTRAVNTQQFYVGMRFCETFASQDSYLLWMHHCSVFAA